MDLCSSCRKNLAPAGSDADIILHRSTDGGTTWSSGIRVNQDALNNGKVQYCPALVVGGDGSINVVYYDNRNISTDSATVYLSRSTDGGNTWTDLEVADHHFKPKPIAGLAGGYQGTTSVLQKQTELFGLIGATTNPVFIKRGLPKLISTA